MTEPMSGQRSAICLGVIANLIGVLIWVSAVDAKSSPAKSSSAPASTAAKAAACDYHSQPTITTVKPDRAKPGQKITINGKNFGTKECFHNVTFGARSANEFAYVSPTTLEVTVPNLQPGSVPVRIYTEAGTSQMNVEIQAK
jgi:IPT/TIG domain